MLIHKTLFSCVTGSKLHRTDTKDSDTDLRVVYRDSLEDRLSPLNRQTTTHTDMYTDTTYFELTHFAKMLHKCNPTAIEILHGSDMEGDHNLAGYLALAAMDTDKYVAQCNGMILGMIGRATPKRLHHAARIHTHLTMYVKSGILEFNAAKYDNYEYLCALKRGEAAFDEKYAEKVVRNRMWDEGNEKLLNSVVVRQYKEDLR